MDRFNESLTNIFLGTIQRQTLVRATITEVVSSYLTAVEGVLMIAGNVILICAILIYKELRRKELYMLAGLAAADLIYGIGYLFAGIRRSYLAHNGMHLWQVTPWSCMLSTQNTFFIAGSQLAALMLVMVSIDRLLAIRWFSYYMGLNTRYAKTILLIVFGYSFATVPVAVLLSAYATNPMIRVAALCLSTQVGPEWFAIYQPTIQMTCGILSVLVYILVFYFYKKQVQTMPQNIQNQNMKRQRKLTRTVGITVLFSFFCYIVPHSMIFILNTFQASKNLLGLILMDYGWNVSGINSIVNIFIIGFHNNDVQRVLKAWLKCKKPQFAGGHTM